jgi:four helix bundle protein
MNVFEDLEVWKKSCRLTVAVYESLKNCNDRCFKDQMTRAALSIPSNIAEGAERRLTANRLPRN